MDERIQVRLREVRARCGERPHFVEDWIVYAVVALDLAIRRAAIALISGRGRSCRS